ncbi:MAG: hypothetical protein OXC29_25545 [Rhodococcus sp.]|nr:hypothetical protein [Rhodococcus sp. (in: high G+C Gram-positive bacteria)]
MDPLHSTRRAWSDRLNTYLRGATGLVYHDGDLIDLWTHPLPVEPYVDGDDPADMALLRAVGSPLVCDYASCAKFAGEAESLFRACPNG